MAIVVTTLPGDIAVEMGRDADSLDNLERAQFQRWIDDAALLIAAPLISLVGFAALIGLALTAAMAANTPPNTRRRRMILPSNTNSSIPGTQNSARSSALLSESPR